MSSESLSIDPATLAETAALNVFYQRAGFERLPEDEDILGNLDAAADQLGLIDKPYWVDTSRALSIPVDFESDQQVRMIDFKRFSFEGTFVCYSKVLVGRILGAGSVRALCLTFNDALLMPYMERLPERHLLYVPVPAVNTIDATSRLD